MGSFKMVLKLSLAVLLIACLTDAGYVSHKNQPKCHTEYETVTSYEQQCVTVCERECNNVPQQRRLPKVEKLCQTVDVQECNTRYERECNNRQENQCAASQETQCSTSYEQECTTEYDQQCSTTYDQ